jgi:hypothetical protein
MSQLWLPLLMSKFHNNCHEFQRKYCFVIHYAIGFIRLSSFVVKKISCLSVMSHFEISKQFSTEFNFDGLRGLWSKNLILV